MKYTFLTCFIFCKFEIVMPKDDKDLKSLINHMEDLNISYSTRVDQKTKDVTVTADLSFREADELNQRLPKE